jgi:hypothetical protein
MRLVVLLAALTATATAAAAADRYGAGGAAAQAAQAPAAPRATSAPAPTPHLLSWSGKTQPTAPAAAPQQVADARPAPMVLPPPQAAWRRPSPAAPPVSTAPAYTAQTAAPQTAAPPTSLYAAPTAPMQSQYQPRAQMAAAVPAPASSPYKGGPRFYSLHREYGVAPDPIALPQQQAAFNGAQTDLAEPPPPADPRTPAQHRAAAAQAGNGVASARPGSQGGDWGASDDPGLASGDASQGLTGQTPTDTGLQTTTLGSGHP